MTISRERNSVSRRKQRLREICKTGRALSHRGEIIAFEGVQKLKQPAGRAVAHGNMEDVEY